MKFSFNQCAGVFCFYGDNYTFHFLVKKQFRQYGYRPDWYDGPIYTFGFGPFFLINYSR